MPASAPSLPATGQQPQAATTLAGPGLSPPAWPNLPGAAALAASYPLGARLTLYTTTVTNQPSIILAAMDSGLPVVVSFHETGMGSLMMVQRSYPLATYASSGLYNRGAARGLVRRLMEAGFTQIKEVKHDT